MKRNEMMEKGGGGEVHRHLLLLLLFVFLGAFRPIVHPEREDERRADGRTDGPTSVKLEEERSCEVADSKAIMSTLMNSQ